MRVLLQLYLFNLSTQSSLDPRRRQCSGEDKAAPYMTSAISKRVWQRHSSKSASTAVSTAFSCCDKGDTVNVKLGEAGRGIQMPHKSTGLGRALLLVHPYNKVHACSFPGQLQEPLEEWLHNQEQLLLHVPVRSLSVLPLHSSHSGLYIGIAWHRQTTVGPVLEPLAIKKLRRTT